MEKEIIGMNLEVGNDNGNSEHDIVINGIQIQQPNVIAKIRNLPMLDEVNSKFVIENIEDNLIVTLASTSAEPGIYFIGKYALASGERIRNIEVGADNSKLNSDVVIISTLGQIAAFAVKQVYLKNKNLESLNNIELAVKADMTTALPVTQYSKTKAEEFGRKFTKDNHIVKVHIGNITVNVNISFEFIKVLPESVSATFALQNMISISKSEKELTEEEKKHNDDVNKIFKNLNDSLLLENKIPLESKIDGNFFKNKRILHAGIGEGTTEYPLTKDITFDPNFIRGSNNGIGHAIDKALPEFQGKNGLLTYSRQKYSQVLLDPNHKYYNIATDIVEQFIEEEAEEVLHNIKNEIQRANNEIDIVAVYGGGSIFMKKYLEEKLKCICEKANIILFYISSEYAVTLESQGMYQFTKSKIFKMLKENNSKTN